MRQKRNKWVCVHIWFRYIYWIVMGAWVNWDGHALVGHWRRQTATEISCQQKMSSSQKHSHCWRCAHWRLRCLLGTVGGSAIKRQRICVRGCSRSMWHYRFGRCSWHSKHSSGGGSYRTGKAYLPCASLAVCSSCLLTLLSPHWFCVWPPDSF